MHPHVVEPRSNTNSEHTGKRGPSGDPADPSSGAKATGDPEYSPVLGFLEAPRKARLRPLARLFWTRLFRFRCFTN